MPRPAATLTNEIIKRLTLRGAYAWRAASVGVYDSRRALYRTAPKKGVSDVLAVFPPDGRLWAIEVKIGSDKLSPEQIGFMKNVEHVGGYTCVVDSVDSFESCYTKAMQNE